MTSTSNVAALLGRLLIVLLFIPSGIGKIGNFAGTTAYVASSGLPMPAVGTTIAIVVELLVALALLLGWQARWAALIMAIFTVVAALFFHRYWASPPDQQMMQYLNFYKNLSTAGGLLLIYAFGPGKFSMDARAGRA